MGRFKIKDFFLVVSFFFSLLFHLVFFNLFPKKNSEKEIFVLELGQYQQHYQPEIIKKSVNNKKKNEKTEIIPEKEETVSKKQVVDENKIKKLIVKKPNLPEKKNIVTEKSNQEINQENNQERKN